MAAAVLDSNQTYECIDTHKHYSRYYVGNEESVWCCDYCDDQGVDPYEMDCSCYSEAE